VKILITGATGLIGSEIVGLCLKKGCTVHYLTTQKKKIVSKDRYHGFHWNPAKGEIDLECFKGVDAIINLAGESISKRWTANNRKRIMESRINSLRTLAKGLEDFGDRSVSSFVSASAIGIYPDSLSDYYTEEEQGVDDSFLGEVVSSWEREADAFKKFGFPVAKIRIGLVLSTKGGALPKMAKPIDNYIGAAFGTGEQWQSWIHIRDLARIFLFAVHHRLEGIYNGVGPNPVSNNKLTKEIAVVLNKPLILPNIPRFAMKLLLGNMSYILFASQRVSSKKIEDEGFSFHFQNICRSLEELYQKTVPQKSPISLDNTEYQG
tara:strand:+ start:4034 stop:4996 length:963 start_codon:yes stop_codon:yes gene_type:complete